MRARKFLIPELTCDTHIYDTSRKVGEQVVKVVGVVLHKGGCWLQHADSSPYWQLNEHIKPILLTDSIISDACDFSVKKHEPRRFYKDVYVGQSFGNPDNYVGMFATPNLTTPYSSAYAVYMLRGLNNHPSTYNWVLLSDKVCFLHELQNWYYILSTMKVLGINGYTGKHLDVNTSTIK